VQPKSRDVILSDKPHHCFIQNFSCDGKQRSIRRYSVVFVSPESTRLVQRSAVSLVALLTIFKLGSGITLLRPAGTRHIWQQPCSPHFQVLLIVRIDGKRLATFVVDP
jgi:hypothetical protein